MCDVLLPPGVNQTAVKYMYHNENFKRAISGKTYDKKLENVKIFKYLGNILTNDARCTCEIKSRIAIAKDTFN
jgi:hypothetical protein